MPKFILEIDAEDRFDLSKKLHSAGAYMDKLGAWPYDYNKKMKITDINGNRVGFYEVRE